MAQGRIQSLRSQTKAVRPTAGSRQPGELYVNFADRQIGFIDQAKAAQDLVAIRYFSAAADYAAGDYVIQGNELYQAKASVTAGSFNAANWDSVINAAELTAALGTTTGDLSGQIGIKNWAQATAYAAGDLVVNNKLIYQAKAAITAGTGWNASLWNDFTAAQSVADKTTLPSQPRTGMLVYNQATGKLAALTSASTQVNAAGAKTVVAGTAPGGSTLDPGDFWWNSTQGSMSLWDGSQFKAVGGGVQVFDNIPPNTSQGALWWESDTGNLYVSFDDGSSVQWVQVNAAQGSPNSIYSTPADMYAGFTTVGGNAFIVNDKADGTGTNVLSLSDAGALTALGTITGGAFNTAGNITAAGTVTASQSFTASTANVILSPTGAGNVYLRPNGAGSVTGQVLLAASGVLTTSSDIYTKNLVVNANSASADALIVYANEVGTQLGWTMWQRSTNAIMTARSGGAALYCYPTIFHCSTNAQKPGGGAWIDSSDERIKTVAGDYSPGLEQIRQLRPVSYTFKGNDTIAPPSSTPLNELEKDTEEVPPNTTPYPNSQHYQQAVDQTPYVGFVAQEIEQIMPGMVSQRSGYIDGVQYDDIRDLDTSNLIYALVNAVKELAAKVEALEAARV